MARLSQLTSTELIHAIEALVAGHRHSVASIVEHLAELDSRGTHLDLGHSSLFAYCTTSLGFSEDEACRRIDAARLTRKFPCVLGYLSDGSVTLTNLALLKHHLTTENCDELLALISHQSVRAARERLATRFPLPDVPESLRKKPVARTTSQLPAMTPLAASLAPSPTPIVTPPTPVVLQRPASAHHQGMQGRIDPLSRDRFQLRVTVSRAIKDHLEQARDLLRHKFPGGEFEVVLGEALELLVQRLRAKKFGERRKGAAPRRGARAAERKYATTVAPQPMIRPGVSEAIVAPTQSATGAAVDTVAPASSNPKASRRPRAKTRREVTARDGAQCAFVGSEGRRCSATAFLEFDHVTPAALGGGRGADNLRCLCRAHNQREAERWFGKAHIDHVRTRTRESPRP